MLLIYSGEIGNALTFLQMPDVKIVDNALQNIPHVLSNRCVSVRNKCCYAEAIRNEVVHAQLKCHELHCRTTSCLISLQRRKTKVQKVQQK